MVSNSLHDVLPHLRQTLFMTGSFCIAWSWDLVLYGASHSWYGENPMRDQIGFGGTSSSGGSAKQRYLVVLIPLYLSIVMLAALASYYTKQRYSQKLWCAAALVAIEFLPAPIFSGMVMAYLGQFKSQLGEIGQLGMNLGATAFAALLVHLVQYPGSSDSGVGTSSSTIPHDGIIYQTIERFPPQLIRFRPILCDSMGFGLGVAWNVFLMGLLAPERMDAYHIIGLTGYLLVVLMLAFRVAALVKDGDDEIIADNNNTHQQSQANQEFLQRLYVLLSFALNVVCAFTAVSLIHSLVAPPGWLGDGLCVLILIFLAAILSAIVASVHIADGTSRDEEQPRCGLGTCWAIDLLIFVPCTWCCCPWIPLVWILAGITPDLHVKEKWYKLIEFVLGLASSIQASGMLTSALDQVAAHFGICAEKHCHHPYAFVCLQIALALAETCALLFLLRYTTQGSQSHSYEEIHIEAGLPPAIPPPTERQSLLKKAKNSIRKFQKQASSFGCNKSVKS